MKNFIVAIDGPAASGKSTTARLVARQLGWTYVDTGAMYRAVTLAVLQQGVSIDDEDGVVRISGSCRIEFLPGESQQSVELDGADVTPLIRSAEVTGAVSKVSSYLAVRARMVAMQREFATKGSLVMDGRDIGTVVFPDADVKVFLVASIHERARRRVAEQQRAGIAANEVTIAKEIERRDRLDAEREHSPLKRADDAVILDTTAMTIEEQCEKILEIVRIAVAKNV